MPVGCMACVCIFIYPWLFLPALELVCIPLDFELTYFRQPPILPPCVDIPNLLCFFWRRRVEQPTSPLSAELGLSLIFGEIRPAFVPDGFAMCYFSLVFVKDPVPVQRVTHPCDMWPISSGCRALPISNAVLHDRCPFFLGLKR